MKMFEDGKGNSSSTRAGFLGGMFVLLVTWSAKCFAGEWIDPTGVAAAIVALGAIQVGGKHVEGKSG